MTDFNLEENILKELLNIFSKLIKTSKNNSFLFSETGIEEKDLQYLINKSPKFDVSKVTFETKSIYQYFLSKIKKFLPKDDFIIIKSYYSFLYFMRTIEYLQILIKSNSNIVEDNTVKLFFFLLFLYFEENYNEKKKFHKKKIFLDESFFKGTFIELNEKYPKYIYKDSEEIKSYIEICKYKGKKKVKNLIEFTFQNIKEYLQNYGNESDGIIKKMFEQSQSILVASDYQNKEDLTEDFVEKINNFYSIKEFIAFTNYISEKGVEGLEDKIDASFLNKIKDKYFSYKLNYLEEKPSIIINHKDKLEKYKEFRNIKYKRMFLSSLPEVLKWNLNDEVVIFSLANNDITHGDPNEFEYVQIFKNQLENLEQNKTRKCIEEILNENEFYEYYFFLLNSDIIKEFFTSNLSINDIANEFQLNKEKSQDSECFDDIYSKFLKSYNRKNENFKDMKNLIILKILPFGDRAYTISALKKIVVNPVQFFFGKEINKEDMKIILKGYILVILLHETEHFFRLLNESDKIFNDTPREKEGGRLFIKYLFGVETINHINAFQAKSILNKANWTDSKNLKNIFKDQLEDIDEANINEFLSDCFPNSISFYSMKNYKFKNASSIGIKK